MASITEAGVWVPPGPSRYAAVCDPSFLLKAGNRALIAARSNESAITGTISPPSADYLTRRSGPILRNVTLADYAPILVMLVLAAGFVAVSLVVSRFFRPDRPTPEKLAPYECGIIPEVEPSQRFPVKFYLVAMLFVIFDVEIIFLFAWASIWDQLGWYGVAAVLIFTFFVIETLMYVWKRGALDWNVHRRARYIHVDEIIAPEVGEAA
jgi:NADH-quinone oxidoreductase subunit A